MAVQGYLVIAMLLAVLGAFALCHLQSSHVRAGDGRRSRALNVIFAGLFLPWGAIRLAGSQEEPWAIFVGLGLVLAGLASLVAAASGQHLRGRAGPH